MIKYRYVKYLPVQVTIPVIPFLSALLGMSLLIWVLAPIISFKLFYNSSTNLVTPLADEFIYSLISQSQSKSDLTKASNWFPDQTNKKMVTPVDTYKLSIPKLRIQDAIVKIGANDLSQNLIHYGGTGLPGEYGTTVIFGHSILPQFYDPNNYLSIFSLLPTLEEGDELFVNFDGISYRYEIINTRVTTPEDVTGLEQKHDNSYITLVTCVPPGTYLQRLWVTAKLQPFARNRDV